MYVDRQEVNDFMLSMESIRTIRSKQFDYKLENIKIKKVWG